MTTITTEAILDEDVCELRSNDAQIWRRRLELDDTARSNPFREALVWPATKRVVVGAGQQSLVLHLDSGELDQCWDLGSDDFGHLALTEVTLQESPTELLLVLGWTSVRAYGTDLHLRWCTSDVAVDGITFDRADGPRIHLHAEMDPPGGWFAVTLDAETGKELARRPDFAEDYAGIYAR